MNNFNLPLSYDQLNVLSAQISPSTQKLLSNATAQYFCKYLLEKAISVYKLNCPDTWDKLWTMYLLFAGGRFAVINTDKFGVIPQPCTLGGRNIYYQPYYAVVSNPLLRNSGNQLVIGRDCGLVRIQADYGGILDIVGYYAGLMATATQTLVLNIQNSKLSYIFLTDDRAGAETFKKIFDEISVGTPAVVAGKAKMLDAATGKPNWLSFFQNVKQSYIGDQLILDLRKIEQMFDTEIGIPNANTEKRERLLTDEVNANNVETATKCELWLETAQAGCEKVSKLFNIELSIDWRHKPQFIEGGADDERGIAVTSQKSRQAD